MNPHGFSEWHRSELSLREGTEAYIRKVSIIFFHRIRSSELSNEAVFSFNIEYFFTNTDCNIKSYIGNFGRNSISFGKVKKNFGKKYYPP